MTTKLAQDLAEGDQFLDPTPRLVVQTGIDEDGTPIMADVAPARTVTVAGVEVAEAKVPGGPTLVIVTTDPAGVYPLVLGAGATVEIITD